ncbi:DUF2971 domain-containing protein [Lysobacter soli]|uniref:DUF2971 domain-containing protein n=1 Tax=Lysobacter soli TaxID=453783 RepID=UPI0012ED15EF|nr:DUF2971 domain-containing protein [Lysobacter soli]QGW66677.1 DUF2971 domain-containing protein [Lysobacter soli]
MGDVHFFRYTDLPSLIHILKNRQLTLLDPMTWDDKNDSSFVTLYREKSKLASVLALCFTRSQETYHHWRIFAPTSSGVRITLNEQSLRNSIDGIDGLQLMEVEYVKLEDIRSTKLPRHRLPFIKRYPYRAESEVRLLWESETEEMLSYALPIELNAIRQVTLSPWLHPALVESVKSSLKAIDGCSKLTVHRTTLISNDEWLKHGTAAT